ncbi:hypothetical protein HPB51_013630 [Rhipicephalus microplus]|uniref:Uncharacterized protein n=1 Tax=Rhipicephalus microplus TaxID=6941 RepID=A0A9J6EGI2_RHIMP|nr:hypothetical protein HPB51_013630 [Rhipicephalus microplus]
MGVHAAASPRGGSANAVTLLLAPLFGESGRRAPDHHKATGRRLRETDDTEDNEVCGAREKLLEHEDGSVEVEWKEPCARKKEEDRWCWAFEAVGIPS